MPYREVWRGLDIRDERTDVGPLKSSDAWILESVSGVGNHEKTFYARAGRFFLVLHQAQIIRQGGLDREDVSSICSAIREDFDFVTNSWSTKYSIGNVENMLKMSNGLETVIENVQGTTPWKVGDIVLIPDNTGDKNRNRFIVRGLAD